MKKVLYVGPLNDGGTCYSRLKALCRLDGVSVTPFDTNQYLNLSEINRIRRWVGLLFFNTNEYNEVNNSLLNIFKKVKPEIVWFDKPFWLHRTVIKHISSLALTVHHNTDYLRPKSLKYYLSRRLLRSNLSYFDWFVTTNDLDYKYYSGVTKKGLLISDLGFDEERFRASNLEDVLNSKVYDVVFIGHWEPETERYLERVLLDGINLRIFGSGWETSALKESYPNSVGGYLNDSDYEKTLRAAHIGVCIYSHINSNTCSGRTFEIPASGAMLLALDSIAHRKYFKSGKECILFSNPIDLSEMCQYYLNNIDECEKITRAGYARCIVSGYSWQKIFARDFHLICRN